MKFVRTYLDTKLVKDLSDVRNLRVIDMTKQRVTDVTRPETAAAAMTFARNGQSAATDWMKEKNFTEQIIKVVHDLGAAKPQMREAKLGEMFRSGIQLDVVPDRKYVRLGQGASDARVCKTVFATPQFKDEFTEWYCLGKANRQRIFDRMKPEKVWIYILQAFSSSSLWANSFPAEVTKFMPEPDLDKIAVFEDMKLEHGEKLVKYLKGATSSKSMVEIVEKDSDGLCIIVIHDVGLSDDEREELNELIALFMLQSFSIRMPGVKGLCVPVLESTLRKVLEDGKTKPDLYGKVHDLADLDLILFDSSFKWVSAFDTPELFEQYKAGFRAYGHSIRVCKQNHPNAWRRLPAQQMQAILPDQNESWYLKQIALTPLMRNLTLDGIFRLIPNVWQRKVAKIYPAFLGDFTLKSAMQTRHITNVKQAMEGCLPNVLRYTFCAPDMLPVICHIGGKPLITLIDEGSLSVDMGTVTIGQGKDRTTVPLMPYGEDTVITRNPTPGLGVCVLKNVKIPDKYRGLYLGNTCFISVKGIEMRTLSMDYDGDTVGLMSCYWKYAKLYADALARAKKTYDYDCVCFENASGQKVKYSNELYNNMLIHEQASQVGLVIDGITRLLDKLMERATMGNPMNAKDLNDFTVLEGAATLIIDAAKNGQDEDVQATVTEANAILKELKALARPVHTFWKKEVRTNDLADRDYDIYRTKHDMMPLFADGAPKFVKRQNWMGDYVATIESCISGKLPIDEWVENGVIDKWISGSAKGKGLFRSKNMFMSAKGSNLPSLFTRGNVKYEDGKVDWSETVYGRIVDEYLHAKEDLKSAKLLQQVIENRSIEWKNAIFTEGLMHGKSHEETLACLIHACYLHGDWLDESEAIITSNAKEVLWILFGEDIFRNVVANLKLTPEQLEEKLGEDAAVNELDYEEGMTYVDEDYDD